MLRQPATGESAFVQVKSRAGQTVLDDYVGRFRAARAHGRMFFLCHSSDGTLAASTDRRVHTWAGPELASATVRAGLYGWLMKKGA